MAEKIVGRSGKVSKTAKKNAVARAKLNAKNPAITDKIASEELTDEQVDVIADADRKTDGAAGVSAEFIDAVANAGVDGARGVAADFVTDHANADGTQTEHDRQRLLRKAHKFGTDRRTEAIMLDGDKASINKLWAAAEKRADDYYRHDGGRDLAIDKHPRTRAQRLFDAIVDIVEDGLSVNDSARNAAGGDPASSHANAAAPGGSPSGSKRHTPKVTSVKPTIVIAATLDKVSGLDPDAAAEMVGTGPIADSVLAEYIAADVDIVGMIFGLDGQPLWLGRSTRLASHAQQLALIVRDKRCVLCGADASLCKAHHIMPWNAPAKGETDITKLVLVCDSCHHHIHDNHQTIYRDPGSRRWRLRPALPHKIAPSRPPKPGDGQAPQRT